MSRLPYWRSWLAVPGLGVILGAALGMQWRVSSAEVDAALDSDIEAPRLENPAAREAIDAQEASIRASKPQGSGDVSATEAIAASETRTWVFWKAEASPQLFESYRKYAVSRGPRVGAREILGPGRGRKIWLVRMRRGFASQVVELDSSALDSTALDPTALDARGNLGRSTVFVRGHSLRLLRVDGETQSIARTEIPAMGILLDEAERPLGFTESSRVLLPRLPFSGWLLYPGFMPCKIAVGAGASYLPIRLDAVAWVRGRVAGMKQSVAKGRLLVMPGGRARAFQVPLAMDGSFDFGPVAARSIEFQLIGVPVALEVSARVHRLRKGHQELPPLLTRASYPLLVTPVPITKVDRVWFQGWYPQEKGFEEAARDPLWPEIEGRVKPGGDWRFDAVSSGRIAGLLWSANGVLGEFPRIEIGRNAGSTTLQVEIRSPGSLLIRPAGSGGALPEGCSLVIADASYGKTADQVRALARGLDHLRLKVARLDRFGQTLVRGLWPRELNWSLVSTSGICARRGSVRIPAGGQAVLDLDTTLDTGEILVRATARQGLRFALFSHEEGLVSKGRIGAAESRNIPMLPAGNYDLACWKGSDKWRKRVEVSRNQTTRVQPFQ